jgi:outer membrane murein-binding lipoprotein Lpp
MSMWTAIALIAIASILAGVLNRGKKQHKEETSDELKELHAKVDALENNLRERVETLERIVTNPQADLKRQFDHLDKAS